MSENLPTQFPKSPELRPLRSIQSKIWQIIGLVLIIGGLAIMIWGSWTFYQQQAELYNPPARIIDASDLEDIGSVEEDIAPPTVPSRPVTIEPETDPPQAASEALAVETVDSPKIVPTSPQELNPLLNIPLEDEEDILGGIASEEAERPPAETVSIAEAKFTEETTLAVEQASEAAVPSLADNPLVVVEDDISSPAEGETAVNQPGTAASTPPTRIVGESIRLDSPVVETGWQEVVQDGVTTNVWVVADYAAGWHENSAVPGQGGNIVLSGHHNIKGEVFRYIVDLEVGDIITLYVDDQRFDYAVNDKFIVKDKGEPESVRRANAKWIGPFNEERLTLVTCWPYNNNTHRVIVIARPV